LIPIPDNIDSKYRFVILTALRARQLQGGSVPLVDMPGEKVTRVAREEVSQGLIQFTIPEKVEKG
jgi:DNA-directed RNA polymerase omega subunit